MNLLKKFSIGRNKISRDGDVYIIAEIGVNHNGSELNCKKLIYQAKKCGADAVKLQIANPYLSYEKNHPSFIIINFFSAFKFKIVNSSNVCLKLE